MTRLLYVESSPRGADSVSTTVARAFPDAYRTRVPAPDVDTLNVWHEDLPEFDPSTVGVTYKPVSGDDLDARENATWDRVAPLVDRVRAADEMVLTSPMWNWSMPYKLKQFIDLVGQRDRLFTFDGRQYGPALDLGRALLIRVRGQGRWT